MTFDKKTGKIVNGGKLMPLFWSPGRGFCQQMVADVKALQARTKTKGRGSCSCPLARWKPTGPMVFVRRFCSIRASRPAAPATPPTLLVDAEGRHALRMNRGIEERCSTRVSLKVKQLTRHVNHELAGFWYPVLVGRLGRVGKSQSCTQTHPDVWPMSTEHGKQWLTEFVIKFSLLAPK